MKIILKHWPGSTLHGTSVDDGLEDIDLIGVCIEDRPPNSAVRGTTGTQRAISRDTWVERTAGRRAFRSQRHRPHDLRAHEYVSSR